jgi:predicted SprT family Zn-dependent metalloprotease
MVGRVEFLVASVPIRCVRHSLRVLALDTKHALQQCIAHELCHNFGFVGRWRLALRVDSGR